jgi:hypothetical protein
MLLKRREKIIIRCLSIGYKVEVMRFEVASLLGYGDEVMRFEVASLLGYKVGMHSARVLQP